MDYVLIIAFTISFAGLFLLFLSPDLPPITLPDQSTTFSGVVQNIQHYDKVSFITANVTEQRILTYFPATNASLEGEFQITARKSQYKGKEEWIIEEIK